jgi:hypothetical protein
MRYNLDLNCFSVKEYKILLKNQNLLPGRRILLQDIDKNFSSFENHGINTVAHLKFFLSTPQKIEAFATGTGISCDYLIILKREIGSLEQKPVLIDNFPGINASLVSELNVAGIKNSKDYFESGRSDSDELFSLCNLVRINGVGAIAAKAFYDAGYKSVSDVAYADAAVMLEKLTNINKARQYYKANLGLKDMQFCIDFASLLIKFCN